MAYKQFPTELNNPLRASFSVSQKSNTIRSKVDIGEAKVRRRYTHPIFEETWSLTLNEAQLDIFNIWFNDDLASGVNRFYYSPDATAEKAYRIIDMPVYNPYGTCNSYVVKFKVEKLP